MSDANGTSQHRPCPICDGRDTVRLHAMHFMLPAGSPLPDTYAVVACATCGFIFADTAGTQDDYSLYYMKHSHYEDPAIATGGGVQAFDRKRLQETASWIADNVDRAASVLDIGCGNGGLLIELRNLGFTDLTGMDPSQGCVDHVRDLNFKAMQGGLGGTGYTGMGQYDLIVLSHVLEHLLEPRAALIALREWLPQDGRIYLEVPDALHYVTYPSVPFYYFDSEHINHFDPFSLENLARTSGYCIQHSGIKTLELPGGHLYPAAYALMGRMSGYEGVVRNTDGLNAVQAYIEQSRVSSQLPEVLLNAIQERRPIAIWGAGSQAQRLLQLPAMVNAHILSVVDNDRNKQGILFAGRTVRAPSEGLTDLSGNVLVIIAAALVAEQIMADYRAMGLPYECCIC